MSLLRMCGRTADKFVQKVLNFSDANFTGANFPVLCSYKLDGVYCVAHRGRDVTRIYSRTGKEYLSMNHIAEAIHDNFPSDSVVIFEAYLHNTPQQTINGWCRDKTNQHPQLNAYIHDYMDIRWFVEGGGNEYIKRYTLLKMIVPSNHHCLRVTDNWFLYSEEAIKATCDHAIKFGYEGVVIRNPAGLYRPGERNIDMCKMKRVLSFDLQVASVERGNGKYANTTGTIGVIWQDGSIIPVSGMTDAQRNEWWRDPNAILGKVVEVHAMTYTKDGKLREPRFKGIRYDKDVPDFSVDK